MPRLPSSIPALSALLFGLAALAPAAAVAQLLPVPSLVAAGSSTTGEVLLEVTPLARERGQEVARLSLWLNPGRGLNEVYRLRALAADRQTAIAGAVLAGVDLMSGADPRVLEDDLRAIAVAVRVEVVRVDRGDVLDRERASIELVNLVLTGASLSGAGAQAAIATIRDGAAALGRGGTCGVPGCPGACNKQGLCVAGRCFCNPGFSGADCSQAVGCPGDCNAHGSCLHGKCFCEPGYSGADCSVEVACPAQCSGNGLCSRGLCFCEPGWSGADCSAATLCPGDCSRNGVCFRGACLCNPGWSGVDCSQKQACPNNCSGHGVCSFGRCFCDVGWAGVDCGSQP